MARLKYDPGVRGNTNDRETFEIEERTPMHVKRSTVCALLVAVCLLAGGRARADMVDFSYSWTISPKTVLSSGTGTVSFALFAPATSSAALNGAPVVVPASQVTSDSTA